MRGVRALQSRRTADSSCVVGLGCSWHYYMTRVGITSDTCCGAQHDADADSEQAQLLAKLLYETALLESGFQLADNKAFNQRVYSLVKDVLDIKKDITAVQEPADDPAEVRRLYFQLAQMLHELNH